MGKSTNDKWVRLVILYKRGVRKAERGIQALTGGKRIRLRKDFGATKGKRKGNEGFFIFFTRIWSDLVGITPIKMPE